MVGSKHVTRGVEKVNMVNYLTRNPPPKEGYYYEKDAYALNDQTGGFQPNSQGSIWIIGATVKET